MEGQAKETGREEGPKALRHSPPGSENTSHIATRSKRRAAKEISTSRTIANEEYLGGAVLRRCPIQVHDDVTFRDYDSIQRMVRE